MIKQLKILVLVAVAVSASMATVGSGSASATSLCEVKVTDKEGVPVCPFKYPLGMTVHAEQETGTKTVVETPLGKAECAKATIKFFTLQETAEPLEASIEAFKIENCGEYTVTPTLNFLEIEIVELPKWTHDGTLTFKEEEIVVEKGGALCEYSVAHAGTLTGGAIMATIDLAAVLTRTGGNGKCPAGNGKLTGALNVTSPAPLWVST
jgi:hypothetical protein